MKAILMSIRPEWVEKILNKEKTIEVRKCFPSDYVGWVYIYCTKGKQLVDCPQWVENELCHQFWYDKDIALLENSQALLNGKVVARFWCDKVEDFGSKYVYAMKDQHFYDILKGACLTARDLTEYAHFTHEQFIKGKTNLYAIHITKLEIFDKPKELSEFYRIRITKCINCKHYKTQCKGISTNECHTRIPLTKAPQSWYFIEADNEQANKD